MAEKQDGKKKNIIDFFQGVIFHNVASKLISVICAVFFWLLITNIADPYKTKSFNVDVQILHEEAISSVHQVYEVIDGKTASVSVHGRRSVVDRLSSDSILATADLSELSSVNAVPIKVELKKHTSSDVTLDCSQVLKISLEDMESKQIKVTVNCEGSPADGYSVGECVAKPNVIEVSGGESVIDRIAYVEVSVNVNGASESFSKSAEPIAYDQKKHKITSATLSFNTKKVRTRVQILQKKSVPVKIQIQGKPAEGYEFIEVNSSPETIEVAGLKKYLDELENIVIPINISGLNSESSNLEQDFDVTKYIDSHLTVPNEEDRNISVKITIQEMEQKTIYLSANQIVFKHLKKGYTAEIKPEPEQIPLVIKSSLELLNGLTIQSLSGYVDCSGRKEGSYLLPVSINLGKEYLLERTTKVQVVIKKEKKEETTTPSPEAENAASPVADG